jgi:predicted sugar kinase
MAEAVVNPVEAGTIINKLDIKPGQLKLKKGAIRVDVPARIHLSVLDMTQFSPGNPGGGGIGYAVGLYGTATVSAVEAGASSSRQGSSLDDTADDWKIDAPRPGIVKHIAEVMRKITGHTGCFDIEVHEHGISHMGLGSTSVVLSSVAYAINQVLGKPLEVQDLRRIIGYNFAEEYQGSAEKVLPGYETGVGPAVGYYGGFAVLTRDLEIVSHCKLEDRQAVIFIPKEEQKNAGQDEATLLSTLARDMDENDRELKAYEVLHNLVPATLNSNVPAIGDCVWRMQHLGSKVAEVRHHAQHEEIYQFMHSLRESGAEIVGMSSVGPAIAAVFPKQPDGEELDLDELVYGSGMEFERVITTDVDNDGVRVEKP